MAEPGGNAEAFRGEYQLGGQSTASATPVGSGAGAGHDGDAPTSPTAEASPDDLSVGDIERARHDLRFSALRNAYYHSARLRHFEALHRWLMFSIVLTGTTGASSLLLQGVGDRWLAALTALLATVDLVLDLRGKAQLHDDLKRRYFMLIARMDEEPNASLSKIHRWQAKIMKITAEEPVTYRAVDAVAHNEAIDTLGYDDGEKQVLSKSQYRWRHFTTAQGVTFPYKKDDLPDPKTPHSNDPMPPINN